MIAPQFPLYETQEAAASWGCRQCCGQLDATTVTNDGYPQGRGRYSMQCTACGMRTWFDIQPERPIDES